jgi:hypothetical protein
MSKQNTKPLVPKTAEKPRIFDENRQKNSALTRPNLGPLAHRSANELVLPNGERSVLPLSAEYTDLLAAPKSTFEFNQIFKQHFLPVAAILFFSLVLVLFYHFNSNKSEPRAGRGVAGDLNDLSNGRYEKQAADYTEEKVCTDHNDGTKTCTTKTKLRREFR